MADLSTIARPYAEALFQVVVKDPAALAETAAGLQTLAQVSQVPQVREGLTDPRLTVDQRASIFLSLVKDPLPAHLNTFVHLLFENNRFNALPEILIHFDQLRDEQAGVAQCEITSAFELTEAQVHALTETLKGKFGSELKPVVKVDPSLIGGVRVTVGDQVLDTSVQAQLQRLQHKLASV